MLLHHTNIPLPLKINLSKNKIHYFKYVDFHLSVYLYNIHIYQKMHHFKYECISINNSFLQHTYLQEKSSISNMSVFLSIHFYNLLIHQNRKKSTISSNMGVFLSISVFLKHTYKKK